MMNDQTGFNNVLNLIVQKQGFVYRYVAEQLINPGQAASAVCINPDGKAEFCTV